MIALISPDQIAEKYTPYHPIGGYVPRAECCSCCARNLQQQQETRESLANDIESLLRKRQLAIAQHIICKWSGERSFTRVCDILALAYDIETFNPSHDEKVVTP